MSYWYEDVECGFCNGTGKRGVEGGEYVCQACRGTGTYNRIFYPHYRKPTKEEIKLNKLLKEKRKLKNWDVTKPLVETIFERDYGTVEEATKEAKEFLESKTNEELADFFAHRFRATQATGHARRRMDDIYFKLCEERGHVVAPGWARDSTWIDNGGEYGGAYCLVCGKSFGWYCPISPKHYCEYDDGKRGYDSDQCIHCGHPSERK